MSHVNPDPAKVAITRAWNDLAPKLLAFLGGSGAAVVLIQVLASFGIVLDLILANVIVVVAGTILGYFVKDKAVIDAGTATPGEPAVITGLADPPATGLSRMPTYSGPFNPEVPPRA